VMTPGGPRIIVALDFPEPEMALDFSRRLEPSLCRVKVGFELFTLSGPDIVLKLQALGFDVFLDLKFHDIPTTVARACTAAANMGVWMMNVHALGGRPMLQAAREAIDRASKRPLLIGVTVLTSHSQAELAEIGVETDIEDEVARLAMLVKQAGLDGVVCSAREATHLRETCGPSFCLVTPGIRPSGSEQNDQTRIVTPKDAVQCGADFLVVGRPISRANDPLAVLQGIHRELSGIQTRA